MASISYSDGSDKMSADHISYGDGSEKMSADNLADDDGDENNKMLMKALNMSADKWLPFGTVMVLQGCRLITLRTMMANTASVI